MGGGAHRGVRKAGVEGQLELAQEAKFVAQ
jgi:hypothetical protein